MVNAVTEVPILLRVTGQAAGSGRVCREGSVGKRHVEFRANKFFSV